MPKKKTQSRGTDVEILIGGKKLDSNDLSLFIIGEKKGAGFCYSNLKSNKSGKTRTYFITRAEALIQHLRDNAPFEDVLNKVKIVKDEPSQPP